MGAKLHSDGFVDLLERLEKSVNEVERKAASALNAEFKRQMEGTKKGPSGRLHASLTSDNSDHIFQISVRGTIRLGSRDPASRYLRKGSNVIPTIEPQPYFDIIAAFLFGDVKSGGRQRG